MNFSQRFNIKIDLEEAQTWFMNRIANTVFDDVCYTRADSEEIERFVATKMGERCDEGADLDALVDDDFYKLLRIVEAVYEGVEKDARKVITELVDYAIAESELDLGIRWNDGVFTRKGAKLLDDSLVNEDLHWLRESGYENVRKPFEKALGHLLESTKHPEVLSDAVTDAYEAMEALVKTVCGNKKDLSGNREQFLSKINASKEFKGLLKQYVEFGNDFRHAADPETLKPTLSASEVEFFIYMTGAFIRMVKESRVEQSKKES